MEMEARGLCQEWPFSHYHLHWVEQGRQMRIPATSAGSSTPYTMLRGATALLILLQSAAFHTASQLRRCQAGPGMEYMPSTIGASSCLELPFPYCRKPSLSFTSPPVPNYSRSLFCVASCSLCYCCSVRLLWQGRKSRLLPVPRHAITQDSIWYLQIQDCGRTGIYSQLT